MHARLEMLTICPSSKPKSSRPSPAAIAVAQGCTKIPDPAACAPSVSAVRHISSAAVDPLMIINFGLATGPCCSERRRCKNDEPCECAAALMMRNTAKTPMPFIFTRAGVVLASKARGASSTNTARAACMSYDRICQRKPRALLYQTACRQVGEAAEYARKHMRCQKTIRGKLPRTWN